MATDVPDALDAPPASACVSGYDYVILIEDPAESVDLQGGELAGCVISGGPRQRIVLNADNAPETIRETLLHELLHAVDKSVRSGLTEDQVWQIARGLFAVFRGNPGVLRYLQCPPYSAATTTLGLRNFRTGNNLSNDVT